MENNNRFSLKMPFFPGFYGSIYDLSEVEYDVIQNFKYETGVDLEDDVDYTFDWKEYQKDVCIAFIDAIKDYIPDFVENVEFDELDSPKYYNFRTDHLYAFVTFKEDWEDKMKYYYNTYKDAIDSMIYRFHTSYDGFISFMDNHIKGWYDKLFVEHDTLYIEYFLKYIMLIQYYENNHSDFDLNKSLTDDEIKDAIQYYCNELDMSVYEDVYADSYMTLTKKGIEKCEAFNADKDYYSFYVA